MTFRATVDESGKIAFPKEALDALGLTENSTFEFEVERDRMIVKPERDMKAFDAAMERYMGSKREELLADGFESVDELMAVIRPR